MGISSFESNFVLINNIYKDYLDIEKTIQIGTYVIDNLEFKINSVILKLDDFDKKIFEAQDKADNLYLNDLKKYSFSIRKKCVDIIHGKRINHLPLISLASSNPEKSISKKSYLDLLRKKIARKLFIGFNQNEKRKELFEKITKLNKEIERLKLRFETGNATDVSQEDYMEKKEKLKHLQESWGKLEKYREKAEETRSFFKKIGGEEVKLITSDHCAINGMFLDVNKFKQKLKEQGGRFATITRTHTSGSKEVIESIAFDSRSYNKNKGNILELLKELGGIASFEANNLRCGSGWIEVDDGHEIFLIRDEHLGDLANGVAKTEVLLGYDQHLARNYIQADTINTKTTKLYREIGINESFPSNTVIITSGVSGVYEMHKQEALSFLFRGMNVFLFNFRGYGESLGIPSQDGFIEDYETALDYVKKRAKNNDEQILLKAICLSSGVAAEIAGRHPKSHVFLDQTYYQFKTLAKDQVQNLIYEILKKDKKESILLKNLSSTIGYLASTFVPKWAVGTSLAKNQGQKLIMYVDKDTLIHNDEHISSILKDLSNAGNLSTLMLFELPGKHGTNWLNVRDDAFHHGEVFKKIEEKKKLEKKSKKQIEMQIQELITDAKKRTEPIFQEVAKIFNQKRITPQDLKKTEELKKKARAIFYEIDGLIEKLNHTAEDLENQIEKEIVDLKNHVDPSLLRHAYSGRQQVNLFMQKTHLSCDIIPFGVKPISPEQELNKMANQMINHLEEIKTDLKYFENLLLNKLHSLSIGEDQSHIFKCFVPHGFTSFHVPYKKIKKLEEDYHVLVRLKSIQPEILYASPQADIQSRILKYQDQLVKVLDLIEKEYQRITQETLENLNAEMKSYEFKTKQLGFKALIDASHPVTFEGTVEYLQHIEKMLNHILQYMNEVEDFISIEKQKLLKAVVLKKKDEGSITESLDMFREKMAVDLKKAYTSLYLIRNQFEPLPMLMDKFRGAFEMMNEIEANSKYEDNSTAFFKKLQIAKKQISEIKIAFLNESVLIKDPLVLKGVKIMSERLTAFKEQIMELEDQALSVI